VSGSRNNTREVKRPEGEQRGPVLDVLRDLLSTGEHEKVIGLVSQLLQRNGELEKKLAKRGLGNAAEGLAANSSSYFCKPSRKKLNSLCSKPTTKLGARLAAAR
jgi:hypothetical protein